MKFAIIILLICQVFSGPKIAEVRALYQEGATDEKACEKLLAILKNDDKENSPLMNGYLASATMMMANYVFNPVQKLKYFYRGKNMIETAIQRDSSNVELRFLRFAAQFNAPAFLGYRDHLAVDKEFILLRIQKMKNDDLKNYIVSGMKSMGQFPEKI